MIFLSLFQQVIVGKKNHGQENILAPKSVYRSVRDVMLEVNGILFPSLHNVVDFDENNVPMKAIWNAQDWSAHDVEAEDCTVFVPYPEVTSDPEMNVATLKVVSICISFVCYNLHSCYCIGIFLCAGEEERWQA
jgi:hypothetical protein